MPVSDKMSSTENEMKLNEKTRMTAAVIIILVCDAVFTGLCLYRQTVS